MSTSYIPKELRLLVAEQAKQRCGYCLTQAAIVGTPLTFDHIIPEAVGGPTTEANLWLACSLCNTYKGNRVMALDAETGVLVPLFNPRTQQWSEHFAWDDQGVQILGLTPTGRATVVALRLNNQYVVPSRRKWVAAGWHPPLD